MVLKWAKSLRLLYTQKHINMFFTVSITPTTLNSLFTISDITVLPGPVHCIFIRKLKIILRSSYLVELEMYWSTAMFIHKLGLQTEIMIVLFHSARIRCLGFYFSGMCLSFNCVFYGIPCNHGNQ